MCYCRSFTLMDLSECINTNTNLSRVFQLMDLLVLQKCLPKKYFPGMNKFSIGFVVFNLLFWFLTIFFTETYLCLFPISIDNKVMSLLYLFVLWSQFPAIYDLVKDFTNNNKDFSYDLFVCFHVLLEVLWSNKDCLPYLIRIPFYYHAKFAFLLWLQLPTLNVRSLTKLLNLFSSCYAFWIFCLNNLNLVALFLYCYFKFWREVSLILFFYSFFTCFRINFFAIKHNKINKTYKTCWTGCKTIVF